MKSNKELLEMLNVKLEKEYNDFIEYILKLEPINIVNKTYELTVKQEIKDLYINNDNFDRYEIKALIEKENILNFLYDSWLDKDFEINNEIESLLQEDISDLAIQYIDEQMVNCANNNKYLIISETLEKLNYYDFCNQIKCNYDLGKYETFSPLLVKEILDSGGTKYLYDFFSDIKDNEQLKYLVEIHTFDNEVYNNIQTEILPKLNGMIKKEQEKQKNQKDREER